MDKSGKCEMLDFYLNSDMFMFALGLLFQFWLQLFRWGQNKIALWSASLELRIPFSKSYWNLRLQIIKIFCKIWIQVSTSFFSIDSHHWYIYFTSAWGVFLTMKKGGSYCVLYYPTIVCKNWRLFKTDFWKSRNWVP